MSDKKWHVGAQNDGLFIIDQPPRASGTDVVWEGRKDVNVIASVCDRESFSETSANANLLAAAPELLRACKAALEEFLRLNPYGRRDVRFPSAAERAVREAVAKAEHSHESSVR